MAGTSVWVLCGRGTWRMTWVHSASPFSAAKPRRDVHKYQFKSFNMTKKAWRLVLVSWSAQLPSFCKWRNHTTLECLPPNLLASMMTIAIAPYCSFELEPHYRTSSSSKVTGGTSPELVPGLKYPPMGHHVPLKFPPKNA